MQWNVLLLQALEELRGGAEEVPIVVGGKRIETGKTRDQLCVSETKVLLSIKVLLFFFLLFFHGDLRWVGLSEGRIHKKPVLGYLCLGSLLFF